MVCHETYKDDKNNWVSPDEIINIDGKKYLKKNKNQLAKVGPSESMSKSKKNTIDPEEIIRNFGADSVRLFILSDSPPEEDIQWSNEGISSSFKFLQKLWSLNEKILEIIERNEKSDEKKDELELITSLFINNVQNNIENFSYNKIIANFHELYSAINKKTNSKISSEIWIKNYSKILVVMIPIIPHFANECLSILEKKNSKNIRDWPKINKNILSNEKLNFVVQFNGKTRGILNINKNCNEEEILNLIKKEEKLNKYLNGTKIKKRIFIQNKLINIIC